MTVRDVMDRLQALGDPSRRAYNVSKGAPEHLQFGVKNGDLRTLAKELGRDVELAQQLWDSGHAEAQMLAILMLTPSKVTLDRLDHMVHTVTWAWAADWLNNYLVKKHKQAPQRREAWMDSSEPWAARSGWSLTDHLVSKKPDGLDLPALLDRIDTELPQADERVQWTMNSTLASIGIHHPDLRQRAVAIGEQHGVYRDYPVSKGCTSPYAPEWIAAMVDRH
jgi:3-methyladenine DNA glycosylase AlkD